VNRVRYENDLAAMERRVAARLLQHRAVRQAHFMQRRQLYDHPAGIIRRTMLAATAVEKIAMLTAALMCRPACTVPMVSRIRGIEDNDDDPLRW
jgi:hypothetical protein